MSSLSLVSLTHSLTLHVIYSLCIDEEATNRPKVIDPREAKLIAQREQAASLAKARDLAAEEERELRAEERRERKRKKEKERRDRIRAQKEADRARAAERKQRKLLEAAEARQRAIDMGLPPPSRPRSHHYKQHPSDTINNNINTQVTNTHAPTHQHHGQHQSYHAHVQHSHVHHASLGQSIGRRAGRRQAALNHPLIGFDPTTGGIVAPTSPLLTPRDTNSSGSNRNSRTSSTTTSMNHPTILSSSPINTMTPLGSHDTTPPSLPTMALQMGDVNGSYAHAAVAAVTSNSNVVSGLTVPPMDDPKYLALHQQLSNRPHWDLHHLKSAYPDYTYHSHQSILAATSLPLADYHAHMFNGNPNAALAALVASSPTLSSPSPNTTSATPAGGHAGHATVSAEAASTSTASHSHDWQTNDQSNPQSNDSNDTNKASSIPSSSTLTSMGGNGNDNTEVITGGAITDNSNNDHDSGNTNGDPTNANTTSSSIAPATAATAVLSSVPTMSPSSYNSYPISQLQHQLMWQNLRPQQHHQHAAQPNQPQGHAHARGSHHEYYHLATAAPSSAAPQQFWFPASPYATYWPAAAYTHTPPPSTTTPSLSYQHSNVGNSNITGGVPPSISLANSTAPAAVPVPTNNDDSLPEQSTNE
jgi:hypothetical protein